MKLLNTPLFVTSSTIALSLLLSACSSEGTVTTLDARPSVTIGLPQVLLNAANVVRDNISPTILLSNGASVTMQKGAGDAWSGTINVAPAAQYTASVTWAETFEGQELSLANLQQTLEVAADGTVVITATSEYSTDIDTDGDGTSNLAERENGTDPFRAPSGENQGIPANVADGNSVDTPATQIPAPLSDADENQNPPSEPVSSPLSLRQ